jgi:hypothetical protein
MELWRRTFESTETNLGGIDEPHMTLDLTDKVEKGNEAAGGENDAGLSGQEPRHDRR